MNLVYTLVTRVDQVQRIRESKSVQDVVAKLLEQTVECGFFIQQYVKHGFAGKSSLRCADIVHSICIGRLAHHIFSDVASKIDAYRESFDKLRSDFETGLLTHNTIVSLRILTTTELISE